MNDLARILLGAGQDVSDVGFLQMALRAVIIYAITLLLVRLGSKRFLSQATAFDVIVAIVIGSVMSRAVNGSAPFIPTVAAGAVLIGVHWLFSLLAYHTEWFGNLAKGRPVLLIKDGEVLDEGVRRGHITPNDLAQALRMQTNRDDVEGVSRAYLERNGQISVIPAKREPRVVDISVQEGVQTVRVLVE